MYSTNKWSLTKEQIDWLLNLLNERRPASVCELGCGVSTQVFLDYIHDNGASLVSFEHDPGFVFHDRTVICELEYTDRTCRYRDFEKAMPDGLVFDFILIDAPYSFDQRMIEARTEMLSFISLGLISDNCVMIIHDSQRRNVSRTMRELEREITGKGYTFTKEDDGRKDKMMTVYRITKSSPVAEVNPDRVGNSPSTGSRGS